MQKPRKKEHLKSEPWCPKSDRTNLLYKGRQDHNSRFTTAASFIKLTVGL